MLLKTYPFCGQVVHAIGDIECNSQSSEILNRGATFFSPKTGGEINPVFFHVVVQVTIYAIFNHHKKFT